MELQKGTAEMTRIEELFHKILTLLDEDGYHDEISDASDLYNYNYLTRSEYEEVQEWQRGIDKEIREKNQKLVDLAKAKLTAEEIEAIQKVGI